MLLNTANKVALTTIAHKQNCTDASKIFVNALATFIRVLHLLENYDCMSFK